MNRLTKKCKNKANEDMYTWGKSISAVINKLGQLEDIEEKYGIDLLTIFKALMYGIDGLNGDNFHKYDVDLSGKTLVERNNKWLEWKLKDYGKTWTVRKEEHK